MSSESRVITLSEVSKSVDYGYTASATTIDTGFKFLRITDIQNGFVEWQSVPFCKIDQALAPKYRLESGDIVVARTGNSTGENYLYDSEEKSIFASYLIRFRIDKSIAEPGYVWRCMRSPSWWDFVNGAKTGSAQAGASAKVLGSFKFELRSLPEQKTIAHILGTLDDKIELNRKTNETLEAIAKALFKSWFVDFDPVRAKAEGRPTGLPAEISDLFPDSFEKSELGEIPRGWATNALDEIANFLNGLALQKFPPSGSATLPVIKIAQLNNGSSDGADRCSTNVPTNYVIQDGDILFSWSGSLVVVIWCGGKGALNQHLFKVTSSTFPKWFVFFWVTQHLPNFRLIAASKATTMGHIQRHHLKEAKVVYPPTNILQSIGSVIAPILDQILANRLQQNTLEHIRDTLLPKLISGELRVSDAEALVAEAGL